MPETIEAPEVTPTEEHLRHIREIYGELQAAEARLADAKLTARMEAKAVKNLEERLTQAIEGSGSPMPLVEVKKAGPVEVNGDDDSWREERLEHALAGITSTLLGCLQSTQLYTVGDLANWTAKDGGRNRLTDIPGIGPGNATKIEEAMESFWARRAERQRMVKEEDAGPGLYESDSDE